MDSENRNILDEIHKGACMGKDALHFSLDKLEDERLRQVLEKLYQDYEEVANKIEDIYSFYGEGEPHKTNTMNKVMTWYGIEMKTLTDKSNPKFAELILQGVNMGIIEGKKILNNKKMDEKVREIVNQYVNRQEKSVEVLKEYL